MQRTLTPPIPRVEHLKEIEFPAARSPAGAGWIGAVLGGERDEGVKEPEGGHVAVECVRGGVGAGEGHGEGEEEDFVGGGGETVL